MIIYELIFKPKAISVSDFGFWLNDDFCAWGQVRSISFRKNVGIWVISITKEETLEPITIYPHCYRNPLELRQFFEQKAAKYSLKVV